MRNINWYLPNFWHCCIILLIMLIAGLILTFAALIAIASAVGITPESVAEMGWSSPVLYIIPFLPAFLFILIMGGLRRRRGLAEIPYSGVKSYGGRETLVLFLLTLPLTLSLSLLLDPLNSLIEIPEATRIAFEQQLSTPWGILSITILAPLAEEFIFRGTMARGMFANYRNPLVGILASALFFGAIHLNLWQAFSAVIIGIVMGFVYYRTHNLWLTIAIHFINNSTATLLYFAIPDNGMSLSLIDIIPLGTYIPCYIASAIVLGVILYHVERSFPHKNTFRTVDYEE